MIVVCGTGPHLNHKRGQEAMAIVLSSRRPRTGVPTGPVCRTARKIGRKEKRPMKIHPLITTTEALTDLCARLSKAEFVAVDTEFMRENTYWPELCLVQTC